MLLPVDILEASCCCWLTTEDVNEVVYHAACKKCGMRPREGLSSAEDLFLTVFG